MGNNNKSKNHIDRRLADDLKKGISDILSNALAGYKDDYKTSDGFVRWGLVEKDIYKLIDSKILDVRIEIGARNEKQESKK